MIYEAMVKLLSFGEMASVLAKEQSDGFVELSGFWEDLDGMGDEA